MRFLAPSILLSAAFLLAGCSSDDGPELTGPTSEPTPTMASSSSTKVTVRKQDFSLNYRLDATTSASDLVVLNHTRGLIWSTTPTNGPVETGEAIGFTEVDETFHTQLSSEASDSGLAASQLSRLKATAGAVIAPVAGMVTADEHGASITTSGIDVIVDLTGIQRLRLESLPIRGAASVETVGGQREVTCVALWVEEAVDESHSGRLHCRLPSTIETVPALRATITLTSDTLKGATVVPDHAVGIDEDGYSVTLLADGQERRVPVEVGPSDGVMRVILTDIPDGATVIPPRNP